MPFWRAKDLINIIAGMKIRRVRLIGGEPSLWPHLFDLNYFCRSKNIKTALVTNGVQFGRDDFWEKYKKMPSDSVGLSIKAYDEESYKCKTSCDNFEESKVGIKRAITTFTCGVNVVYSGDHVDEILSLARFASECGARHLSISPSTPSFANGKPNSAYVTIPQKFIEGIARNYAEIDRLFDGIFSVAAKIPLCLWPRDLIRRMIKKEQIRTTCQLQLRNGLLFDVDGTMISCNLSYPLISDDSESLGKRAVFA